MRATLLLALTAFTAVQGFLLGAVTTKHQQPILHHDVPAGAARRRPQQQHSQRQPCSGLAASADGDVDFTSSATQERIAGLVAAHNVMLFMKGNRLFPQCGYSNTVVQILNQLAVPYETVDVLADEKIRQGIKEYSNWPTIPQLYLGGEFVGGADIVIEMYQTGELQEAIEIAAAS